MARNFLSYILLIQNRTVMSMGTMHVKLVDLSIFIYNLCKYYHLEFRKRATALVHAELQTQNNWLGKKGPFHC